MKLYNQTTDFTCASASLAMILNHLDQEFELSMENEFRIWSASVNLPTRASSIFGLAVFAKENGADPKIILEDEDYDYPDYRFKGYKKKEIEAAEFFSGMHKKDAEKLGIAIEERKIYVDDINELLSSGKILLLRINAGVFRNTGINSQYIVFFGYSDGKYKIYDPLTGVLKANEAQLIEAMETLHTKKKRDIRMIVF